MNYKNWGHSSILVNGHTEPVTTSMKIIVLYKTGSANTASLEQQTGVYSDYQVPTGKKFRILYIPTFTKGGVTDIFTSTGANSAAVTTYILRDLSSPQIVGENYHFDVPAGLFINVTGASTWTVKVVGVELNA